VPELPHIRVEFYEEVVVPECQSIVRCIPNHISTDLLMLAAEGGDVVARIGGQGGVGPTLLRDGETLTLNGIAGNGSIEFGAQTEARVRVWASALTEPSAIDQLADLAR